jgi:hypothetical protein
LSKNHELQISFPVVFTEVSEARCYPIGSSVLTPL